MPGDISLPHRPNSPLVADEKFDKRDKTFRRYASAVERALSLFDTTLQVWADYIAFLGRLLKAFQTRSQGTHEIPYSPLVAKRLSQCLHPSLPSVHQKALEVYGVVFSILGNDGLSRELSLYLPGLSPLLAFASLSVRPVLLFLFETHIVPLGAKTLRPALRAIILALLPGLEDDSNDDFERTHGLLNKLRNAFSESRPISGNKAPFETSDDRYFWQSLFLVCITSSSRRSGVLAFLERNLPRLDTEISPGEGPTQNAGIGSQDYSARFGANVEAVITPEPGLLVRCFSAGLEDEQVLVQRGFLDLLITHLPLNSPVLQRRVSTQDIELLVAAATSVVIRREMSLNRRLWVWLLGGAAPSEADKEATESVQSVGPLFALEAARSSASSYFQDFGLQPLVSSIQSALAKDSLVPVVRARPFRICLSLMDRWEIGSFVVPEVFRPAMENIHNYKTAVAPQDAFSEVLRSANVFFDAIQSRLIWREIVALIFEALDQPKLEEIQQQKQRAQNRLELVWFVITMFNVREEEMVTQHLPNVLILLVVSVSASLEDGSSTRLLYDKEMLETHFKICTYIVETIPAQASTCKDQGRKVVDSAQSLTNESIFHGLRMFYDIPIQDEDRNSPSFEREDIEDIVLQRMAIIIIRFLSDSDLMSHVGTIISLLTKYIPKTKNGQRIDVETILSTLVATTDDQLLSAQPHANTFSQILDRISVLEFVHSAVSSHEWQSNTLARQLLVKIYKSLWPFLSPLHPSHNVEAVKCLWRLHHMCPDEQLAEAAITRFLFQTRSGNIRRQVTIDGARCFATIWTHSITNARSTSNQRPSIGRTDSLPDLRMNRNAQEPEFLARPMLMVLDNVKERHTVVGGFIRTWLQSMPDIMPLIDMAMQHLNESSYLLGVQSKPVVPNIEGSSEESIQADQVESTTYSLRLISEILQLGSHNILSALLAPVTSPHPNNLNLEGEEPLTVKECIVQLCMIILRHSSSEQQILGEEVQVLRHEVSMLLQHIIPYMEADSLSMTNLQSLLIQILSWSVNEAQIQLQCILLEDLTLVFKGRIANLGPTAEIARRSNSKEHQRNTSQLNLAQGQDRRIPFSDVIVSDSSLLDCIMLGLSSPHSQSALEQWLRFLEACLPVYSLNMLQILLPLVSCITSSIKSLFDELASILLISDIGQPMNGEPLQSLNFRLNALELVLSTGHELVMRQEVKSPSLKSPEQTQGFFGNMVPGVLGGEAQAVRSATANNHLTVLLCFRDAVKVAFQIWSWDNKRSRISSRDATKFATFNYMSIRLRNRTRRVLEHLFAAEPLECLETLIEIWKERPSKSSLVLDLLHTLEASRPKQIMPAIFNALYSRTNPTALDPARKSTLTSELSDIQLATFLNVYTSSMDDDALDEVWADCMTFSRDVLGNPMPQRQILPLMLEFNAILGGKVENTNFGEQRRMTKDIGDLFVRLLAANFTIRPLTFSNDASTARRGDMEIESASDSTTSGDVSFTSDVVEILDGILSRMTKLLINTDRIGTAVATISTQILIPAFHWRSFPQNINLRILGIVQSLSRVTEVSKTWRKDVAEAFNEPRFFASSSFALIQSGWMPILRQWTLLDRERIAEVLSRLTQPTSAGIMFGVGASSARLEADRKTQTNLRRISLLIVASDDNAFVANIRTLEDKLADLLNATATSSPSSVTRAEAYMLLRATVLKFSPEHLSSLWPIISIELQSALSAIGHIASRETYNITSILQAAKLLDTLLILAPNDFQLREWLYITDTIDAVYRPADWRPVALVDELAELLDTEASAVHSAGTPFAGDRSQGLRKPLIKWENTHSVPREKVLDQVLKPFLRQLSINAFEATYQMEAPDKKACCDELLRDLFDDSTIV